MKIEKLIKVKTTKVFDKHNLDFTSSVSYLVFKFLGDSEKLALTDEGYMSVCTSRYASTSVLFFELEREII